MHIQIAGDDTGEYELHWRGVALAYSHGKNWSTRPDQYFLQREPDGSFSVPPFSQGMIAAPGAKPQPLTARERMFAFGSPLTDQLTLLYHQWMWANNGHWATPTLFDPVAVAYAIRPELCPMTSMHVDVDDKGFTRRGAGAANAQVCLKSDEKGFLDLLTSRIEGK